MYMWFHISLLYVHVFSHIIYMYMWFHISLIFTCDFNISVIYVHMFSHIIDMYMWFQHISDICTYMCFQNICEDYWCKFYPFPHTSIMQQKMLKASRQKYGKSFKNKCITMFSTLYKDVAFIHLPNICLDVLKIVSCRFVVYVRMGAE